MSHYYTKNSSLPSTKILIKYTYKNNNLEFISDLGVFSKQRVDFGTNILLNTLDIPNEYNKVLDIGCGYGIIGLAVAKVYSEKKVYLIDVNDRAVELTNKNIINNNICNAFVQNKNILDGLDDKYDLIVSNPPIRAGKKVVFSIIEEAYKSLNNKGSLWIVIQKKQGALSLMAHMENIFDNYEVINKEKGYFIIKSIKRN